MIVRRWVHPRYILKRTWKATLFSAFLSSWVYLQFDLFDQSWFHLPFELVPSMTTALTLFLAFRNNSAYDRWWEARKVWGSIVNDTRSISRLVWNHVEAQDRQTFLRRHIAWLYALRQELRKESYSDEVTRLDDSVDTLGGLRSLSILQSQSGMLAIWHGQGKVDGFQMKLMEETLNRLTDHQGKCERIKNTPLPRQYDFYIRIFLFIFVTILPFSLADLFTAERIGPIVIPVTVALTFVFYMLAMGGETLEDPFEGSESDIPMTSMVRNLEIEILELIREEEVPAPVEPVNGVLM